MEKSLERSKKYHLQNTLGVDFGLKVTGLSSFCPGRDPYVTPFGRIIYQSDLQLCLEIKQIVEQESIELVVVGLPHFTDGKASEMTKRVQQFIDSLIEVLKHTPVETQDETLTTFEAKSRMQNSPRFNHKIDPKMIDSLSACIILEDFFGLKQSLY